MHSCVRWCFALKGQCHQIFSFKFFQWIIFPQASENLHICGLTQFVTFADLRHVWQFADLRHVWQFADLQFADPIFFVRFVDFQFANLIFVADLQLPQICKFFMFTNTYLKCSNSNFYQIKNSAKQTCNQLLDSFAIKGGNLKKRLSVLWLKTCRFEICGFAIFFFKFVDSHISEICGLMMRIEPKNLRI